MSFRNPEAFLLFLPLFFLVVVWWFWLRKRVASLSFPSSRFFKKQVDRGLKVRLMHLPELLLLAAIIFMIVALARPQKTDTLIKRNVEGIDIMIALDISDSMLIEDMKPENRLEAAKKTIQEFIKLRSSDRIGVVVFAGESFTLVPLTLDYQLILDRVSEITTARQARIKDGTALGVALANAAGRLRESTAKSRVVIFLTDGENNSGTIDPETGLAIAKGYGIKIYSIGIGQDGKTKLPIYTKDLFGNTIKQYADFESTINEDLLKRMGSETGGRFFRAVREDSLKGVFAEINNLEKTKIDVNKFNRYEELYQKYLFLGVILFLLSAVLKGTIFKRGVDL